MEDRTVTAASGPSLRSTATSTTTAGTSTAAMRGISKSFGTVVANDGVDLELVPGEVHALLGENGAGKTTLMNILFGMFPPDEGEIFVDNEPVTLRSPRDALAHGIGMVHQHFMLVPNFTVAENVALGSKSAWNMKLHRSNVERDVGRVAEQAGMRIPTSELVRDLSIDVQQRVEIVKLLYRGARVLILDEPTAMLGPVEIDQLFTMLRRLSQQGNSVAIITHKLSEVMNVADRVTVLRNGSVATTARRGRLNEHSLATAMIGHEFQTGPTKRLPTSESESAPTLQVKDLTVSGENNPSAVAGVTFQIRPGEILGIAGVEGNGQVELCQAMSGLRAPRQGAIEIDGQRLTGGVRDFYRHGVSVISEDRLRWGLVSELTLAENLTLSAVQAGEYSRWGMVHRGAMHANAERLLAEYDVRPPNPDLRAGMLSGGNQQKVVIAREFSRNPKVLIASQPTRGLDVGAAEFVIRRFEEMREAGCAVLLNSIDLDELTNLADRILVLFRGRVALEAPTSELGVDQIAAAMAGSDPLYREGGTT